MSSNCSSLNSSLLCNVSQSTPTSPLTTTVTQSATLNDKQKARIAIYLISIVLSWVGNGLVITISILNHRSLSPCRILMAHLAVTNFLFSLRIPFQTRLELNGNVWEWGVIYCKLMHGFNSASLFASIATVTVIAIERHRGISKPYSPKWSKPKIIISICIVWVIALVTYTPYMYYLNIHGTSCVDVYSSSTVQKVYSVVLFTMRYVVPLLIMSVCYFKIGLVVYRRPTRISTHQSQSDETIRKRENFRIIRLLIVIVVAFALLTAPTSIWWLWYDFGGTLDLVSLDLLEVFAALLYLHSAINPIIYGVLDKKFKQGVRDLAAKCCIGTLRSEETSAQIYNIDENRRKRTVTFQG